MLMDMTSQDVALDDIALTVSCGCGGEGGHAMRRLVGDIVPNTGSNAVKRQAFDWTLGGTGGIRNKGFIGEVNGKMVALFVAKEGPYQGTVTSSKVVTPEDLRLWGICGC
jgi:hypothetical protein